MHRPNPSLDLESSGVHCSWDCSGTVPPAQFPNLSWCLLLFSLGKPLFEMSFSTKHLAEFTTRMFLLIWLVALAEVRGLKLGILAQQLSVIFFSIRQSIMKSAGGWKVITLRGSCKNRRPASKEGQPNGCFWAFYSLCPSLAYSSPSTIVSLQLPLAFIYSSWMASMPCSCPWSLFLHVCSLCPFYSLDAFLSFHSLILILAFVLYSTWFLITCPPAARSCSSFIYAILTPAELLPYFIYITVLCLLSVYSVQLSCLKSPQLLSSLSPNTLLLHPDMSYTLPTLPLCNCSVAWPLPGPHTEPCFDTYGECRFHPVLGA